MIDIGSQVGDYEVLEKLGTGGAGRVYKVRHRITGRIEALKVLLPGRSLDEVSRERFLREVRVQANLAHANIASVLTAFESEDGLVSVMEFVEGESLGEYLEHNRLDREEQLNYARQALSALAYAHSRGVIHRDIKPENLLIGPAKTLKITDFGLAKTVTDITLTSTGTPMGSVFYISPEQITAAVPVDHRADIYSLGAVLYQLTTGRRPFRGSQAYELMRAHLEQQPVPPSEVDPSIPAGLSQAILKALAKDPKDRFASAEEFSLALQSSAAQSSRPAGRSRPAIFAALADRRLLQFIAFLFILSAAALFFASRRDSQEPSRPTTAVQHDSPAVPAPAPAEESKPSPIDADAAEAPAANEPATPPVTEPALLPATVQVRILNSFGSDRAAGRVSADVVSPAALAGYRIDGRIIEAKSSGKPGSQSELKIAFTALHGAGEAVPIAVEVQGFRNSQGSSGVDENGSQVKLKGGVIQRGKQVASGIGSAVGGLFGRKGKRDGSTPEAATFTAKAARIEFLPGSEFDLYVARLDPD